MTPRKWEVLSLTKPTAESEADTEKVEVEADRFEVREGFALFFRVIPDSDPGAQPDYEKVAVFAPTTWLRITEVVS